MADTSSRKPRSQRINQLLGQIHELEVLDREIKRNNARLTKKNTKLHNSILEMRGMYILQEKKESNINEGKLQALQDDNNVKVAEERSKP